MDLKEQLAQIIKIENKTNEEIKSLLTITPNATMGDFALPCFSFAKERRVPPMVVAGEIAENVKNEELIEKTEIVGGYLNFYLNRKFVFGLALKEHNNVFTTDKNYLDFFADLEEAKTVLVEYSSPNLAKFMHIGHYNCTIYGEAIAKINEFMGHKVVRLNYVGDYGTPFGKMVVAYQKWGKKEDVENRGVDAIQELYIKFNQEENEDLMNQARQASKMIEDKQGEEFEIYNWFIEISLKKVKSIYSKLNINFDDWRGESFYNDKLKDVVKDLKEKGLATLSQGATIVDLNDVGKNIAVVERSDGGSLYITRDLAAIQDRFNRYNFDKHVYVTASQQDLHFVQLIEICKRMGREYHSKLQHASYGLFSTPEGKIASRKGKQALLEDILSEAEDKAKKIIENRTFNQESSEKVALEIAKGAMAFSIFKVEAIKDKVFDLQTAISFDGDTAPYLQYTYARCASIIRKQNLDKQIDENLYAEVLKNDNAFNIFKLAINFKNVIKQAYNENEFSYIARALLDIAKLFNSYYAESTILNTEDEAIKIMITRLVANTIKVGLSLLCINTLEEM